MSRTPRQPSSGPRAKERPAVQRLRSVNRAQLARRVQAARRRAQTITEELARPRAQDCRWQITPSTTDAQLSALGAGCTAGRWVCPTLDAIRRRLKP